MHLPYCLGFTISNIVIEATRKEKASAFTLSQGVSVLQYQQQTFIAYMCRSREIQKKILDGSLVHKEYLFPMSSRWEISKTTCRSLFHKDINFS